LKSDITKQEQRLEAQGALVKILAAMFYFQIIISVLRKFLDVPEPLAIAISAAAVLLPAYWVPPRPEVSFFRYAGSIGSLVAAYVVVLSAPDLLRPYMPIQLAVALPLLTVCAPLYYLIRKLVPGFGRKIRLASWLIAVLTGAMICAGVATLRP